MKQPRAVNEAFDRAAETKPDAPFLDFSGEAYTFSAMSAEVDRLARGLTRLGVTAGERVAIVLDNGPDAVKALLAAFRIGAIAAPLNTANKGEFLRHQLADTGARVAIVDKSFVKRVEAVWDGVPELSTVLQSGTGDGGGRGPGRQVLPLDEFRLDTGAIPCPGIMPSTVAALFYTAGTTGPSKGCMVGHGYLCNVGTQVIEASARRADELNWTPLPLFHLNALAATLIPTIMLGGRASIAPRFSLGAFWPEVERTGAEVVNLLGAMIVLVAQAPDTPESGRMKGRIRAVVGAPFPVEYQRLWRERFGVRLAGLPAYGMTEACLITSLVAGDEDRPGSAGRRNRSFDTKIVDERDGELPAGEVGEVVCRPKEPDVMFAGYWNQPEATVAATRNLWFHTGDLGRMDEDGYLFFVDRKKDYLRRRGENISSFEVEVALLSHPDVKEVAAHAVPSDLSEDDLKITVVIEPGADLTEEKLCRWAVDHLPYFAVPRYVEFRTELPKNPVGRVLKYQLRDEGVTPATWDREAADVVFERR